MKVNDSNSNGVTGLGQAAQAALGRVLPAKPGAIPGDQADVSSLSNLVRALSADRPEHAALVESLTQLVAAASYRVDPDVLSGSIIQNSVR